MKRLRSWVAVVATVTVAVIGVSGHAWAERRVALVVGNSAYKAANLSLANPRNDAEDVSAALKALGFEVVTSVNATKRDMDGALQRFARLATDADSVLFFYAGHAMQFQGRNFLMPVDAELEDEVSLRYQTVGLEDVRAALDRGSGVKILILDACRNNPLADRLQRSIAGASRSTAQTRGLARIDKTQGMVVAYATAADEVAQDGQGRNSPFTTALLKRLQEPGLEIEMMFRRVAYDVNAQTGGRQRPETYISLLSEYYLNQNDHLVWDRIKDRDDVAELREFVDRYPSSPLAILARNRLDLLERYAREREEAARRAREDEQRKLSEAEAQRVAREGQLRREAEERQRAEQKRIEDEQKRLEAARQDALRLQQEEQKRQEALKLQQEEKKRQEALKLQQEEKKRQEALKLQQEEQKRQEALKLQQEEQKRQEALKLKQEEQKRQEALQQQQEEQKRQEALKLQQEEQKRQEALQQQQEEQKRQEALRQQEEQKQVAALPPQKQVEPLNVRPALPEPVPPPVRVNLPEQIRQAQIELKRLGCFSGAPDSKLNDATRNAIKALWHHTHKPVVEINITDDFIAELKHQFNDVCAPPAKPAAPVASRPASPHKDTAAATPPRPITPPATPQPQQERARATAGSPLGTGF
jgi:caspase domain-containing protein